MFTIFIWCTLSVIDAREFFEIVHYTGTKMFYVYQCVPIFCSDDCALFIAYHDYIIPEYNLHSFINKE